MKQRTRTDLVENPTKSISQSEAASRLKVSRDTVIKARKVLDSGDQKIIEAVDQGKLAVSKAAKVIATKFTALRRG